MTLFLSIFERFCVSLFLKIFKSKYPSTIHVKKHFFLGPVEVKNVLITLSKNYSFLPKHAFSPSLNVLIDFDKEGSF